MENNNDKSELKKEVVIPEMVREKLEKVFNTIKENSDKKTQNNV